MKEAPQPLQKSLQPGRSDGSPDPESVLAFETIIRDYADNLMRFVYSRVRSRTDAEDICQETFLKAFQGWHSFDQQSSLKTWLFSIAYHEIVSFLRKKKRSICSTLHVLSAEPSVCTTQEPESENIWHLAEQLPAELYTLLWLKYKEDLSTAQIARILRKSQLNIRVMLHRARRRLVDILQRENSRQTFPIFRPASSTGLAYEKGASHVL